MYRVLHIEQSDFFRKMVGEIVTLRGYDYIATGSFREAYRIFEMEHINLILTSFYATEGKLEDFIQSINKSSKGTPIFVVTSNQLDSDKNKIINLGISDYILKSELREELAKHIDAVFAQDEYMRDLREASFAVVEDSLLEIQVRKDIFSKHGIKNVDYYRTGEELLSQNKNYDIYLIDIVLKNEFGKNIIAKIRRNHIKSSIIAVTSLDNPIVLSAILDDGADDIIVKPLNEKYFIAKLKSHIRLYSLQKQMNSLNNIDTFNLGGR